LLDLKTELQLAPGQQAAVEELFARMQQQALARGKEVLVAEAQLDEMFARGRPEAELREQSFRVASLRAELRWAHLSAHLAARKLLTPEQLAAYQRLRHGEH
jgi:Spy/CpxP family protein refolding chaperone